MTILFTLLFIAAVVGIFKPYVSNSKRWHFGLAAFVAFVLIGVSAPKTGDTQASTTDAAETVGSAGADGTAQEASAAETKPAEKNRGRWTYDEDVDQMRGDSSYYAMLDGTNTLDLDFPYGEQEGRLIIRQSPKFGFDILVGVESGQILCNSYSNSYLNVKFDDGPIKRYTCNDASDGTSNMVFIEGARGFLAELKKSEQMIVEAEFFHNGVQQLTFDTTNLQWDH